MEYNHKLPDGYWLWAGNEADCEHPLDKEGDERWEKDARSATDQW